MPPKKRAKGWRKGKRVSSQGKHNLVKMKQQELKLEADRLVEFEILKQNLLDVQAKLVEKTTELDEANRLNMDLTTERELRGRDELLRREEEQEAQIFSGASKRKPVGDIMMSPNEKPVVKRARKSNLPNVKSAQGMRNGGQNVLLSLDEWVRSVETRFSLEYGVDLWLVNGGVQLMIGQQYIYVNYIRKKVEFIKTPLHLDAAPRVQECMDNNRPDQLSSKAKHSLDEVIDMIMEFKDEIGLSDDCYQKLINIVHRISDLDLPSVKKIKKYRKALNLLLGDTFELQETGVRWMRSNFFEDFASSHIRGCAAW